MPITTKRTDNSGNVVSEKVEHVGCVLEVKKFIARRNMSDTLDYSDWCDVECTSAYIYMGHDKPVNERFAWMDVSNHFAWRGADVMTAEVDDIETEPSRQVQIMDDFREYTQWHEDFARVCRERECKERDLREKVEAEKRAKREANAPKVGRKMTMVRGDNKGYTGVIAYITRNGGCLLKDEANWQDKKAEGKWAPSGWLKSA